MHQPASVLFNRLLARGRFRHVQVLAQLAELGSVRRTAEKVGMTQPGVTQILADLETLVGTPLFHRYARGVRPTAACADLLPLAHEGLRQWGVSDAVRERFLGVSEGRCTTGVNGAVWSTKAVEAFEAGGCTRSEALSRMLELYAVHMDSNEPVYTWPLP